jgi:hypothetical protein
MRGIPLPPKQHLINRQICHLLMADEKLGMAVAKGLEVVVKAVMEEMGHAMA